MLQAHKALDHRRCKPRKFEKINQILAEELEILESEKNDKTQGPFKNSKTLVNALRK